MSACCAWYCHAQHTALLAALRRRDGADAVRILEEHLQPAPEILARMDGSG